MGPARPVGPVVPAGPVRPVGPVVPAGPVRPVGPVTPMVPAGPVGPVWPVGPVVKFLLFITPSWYRLDSDSPLRRWTWSCDSNVRRGKSTYIPVVRYLYASLGFVFIQDDNIV